MSSTLSAASLFTTQSLVAVITGGGSGLGLMAALALDTNGASKVYILGRRESTLRHAASLAPNNSLHPIVCDVTSKTSLQKAVNEINRISGYVNVVLANSGTSGIDDYRNVQQGSSLSELREILWQSKPEDFTKTMQVNVTGVYYTAIAFLDLLGRGNMEGNVAQKSQILITTSAGSFTRVPIAGFDYSASKAGASHMAKALQTMLTPYQIRVNCIAPGLYPSEMSASNPNMSTVSSKGNANDPTVEGSIDPSRIPLARAGNERDFAGAILFLMSGAGAYINGNVLLTDGGRVGIVPSSY